MKRFLLLLLSLCISAFVSLAQPRVDWVHHISSEDTTSRYIPAIFDATVDINHNLILTGFVRDAVDLDSDYKEDIEPQGVFDFFVASYSKEGKLNWAQTAGADSIAGGTGVITDSGGNVYVTGVGLNIRDFNQDGFPDITSTDSLTSFLVKYNTNGQFQWVTPFEHRMSYPVEMLFNEQKNELLISGTDFTVCEQTRSERVCGLYSYLSQFTVTSYSTEGHINWTKRGNSVIPDSLSYIGIEKMALAENGDIHIGGLINGTADIDPTDSFPPISSKRAFYDGGSVFTATLNKEGDLIDQHVTDIAVAYLYGMDITPDGSIYVSTGYVNPSFSDSSSLAGHLIHLNEDRSPDWLHRFTGVDSTLFWIFSSRTDIDLDNILYLSGNLRGQGDLDTDGINDITNPHPSVQAFFAKYQPSGSLEWVFTVDHEPLSESSSYGLWLLTRDGSSMYGLGAFQGTAEFDGTGSLPPITSRGLNNLFIIHFTNAPKNTSINTASPSHSSSLSPAYPNPFNTNTSFTLNVDRPQQVQVSVYNTLGQRTRTLFDGPVHPNEPKHISLEGAYLPSGLYVIRAEGEDFMDMQKVIRIQ